MKRIDELDFVKGSMIALMVFGHIEYIGDTATICHELHDFIYLFHMPVFLFISGYLFTWSASSLWTNYARLFIHIGVPYLLFESVYLLMLYAASKHRLNITNNLDDLSVGKYFMYLCFKPQGVYWFLHTLIIYKFLAYTSHFFSNKIKSGRIVLLLIGLLLVAASPISITLRSVLFLLLGTIYREYSIAIPKSKSLCILPIVLLVGFGRFNIGADLFLRALFVLGVIAILMEVASCSNGLFVRGFQYIGRNTMSILVLHVFFLNILKYTAKTFLWFDISGIVYLIVVIATTIAGSVMISRISDMVKTSGVIFGKMQIYQSWQCRIELAQE